jgi:diacylglycerol kinase (ATP)
VRDFTAIVNPISGGGGAASRWAPLAARNVASGADVQMQVTRSRAHAVECARDAAAAGRVAVAVGGDGLVRDVAEGVVTGDGAMALVPAGRGNDLARALNYPTDEESLARLLLEGAECRIDVIDVGGTIVVGNVYCGIDSVSNAMINRSRRLPPKLVYRLAPVRAILTWTAPLFTVTLDGRIRSMRAHMVVVANSGAYGHGLRIVPSARVDDGQLDVLIVGDGPKRAVASFMREAQRGAHVTRAEVSVHAAREVTLDADRALPVCGDGEELCTLPTSMHIRPGTLRLIA